MDREKMLKCYSRREVVIFKEELGSDAEYHALLERKSEAEKELREAIDESAWEKYLELDDACNELESLRYRTVYLAGAADNERLNKNL